MKLLFLFGFLWSCSLVSGFEYYNCLRDGQGCNDGSCVGGVCSCSDGISGYNCRYVPIGSGSACGGSGCQGDCGSDCTACGLDDVCQCEADKYNSGFNNCDEDRLQLICSVEGKILINANIEGANAVFIDDDCDLDGTPGTDNLPFWWIGPMRAVSTTDGICPIDVTDNGDDPDTNCVEVRVRFGANIWDSRDALIRYCCGGVTVVSIVATSLTVDNVEASPAGIYSDVLVTDGCATGMYQAAVIVDAIFRVRLTFQAIKYVGFDSLYVLCDVRLCIVEANCVASCHGARKKREATTNSTAETSRQLVFPFKVKNPFEQNSVDAAVDKAVAKETTINLSAAVIGLAVVVLILLAACLLLGVCLINKRRAPDLKA